MSLWCVFTQCIHTASQLLRGPGVTDIGGGSVDNDTAYALARIPLRWMVRECFKAKTGIMFDTDGLRGIGIDPHCHLPHRTAASPRHCPRLACGSRPPTIPLSPTNAPAISAQPPSEEDHELRDALSPIYDQLSLGEVLVGARVHPVPADVQEERQHGGVYVPLE